MRERIQPILALLDQGLWLYRRNFAAFVLIGASWLVPLAIAAGLVLASFAWLDELWALLLALGFALLAVPLALYLVAGLSRAAAAAADGQAVRIRAALAIPPRRLAGAGCFGIVYAFVAQIVASVLTTVLICPVYLLGVGAVSGALALTDDSALSAGLLVIVGVAVLCVYGLGLVIGGATYSSLIYALQPWVQESLPFGETLQLSLDLVGYRFARNFAGWFLSALIAGAVGVTVTLTVALLLPLPLLYALGAESPVAQAVSASAWLIGLVLLLPPLPIWMTLLYRRNLEQRRGSDLAARVEAWQRANVGDRAWSAER